MRHNLDTGDFRRFVRGEATARGGEERAVALIGAQRSEALGFQDRVRAVGDCYDNAMCESFFATLECELLDRVRFRSQSEARIASLPPKCVRNCQCQCPLSQSGPRILGPSFTHSGGFHASRARAAGNVKKSGSS